MQESPETSSVSRPLPSSASRLRKRKARHDDIALKSRWLILAMIIIFCVGLALSGEGRDFIRYLYSPVAIIIVIFAIIEYIVLKGRDRSRIYRLESEQARERRRQDHAFMREIEEELGEIEGALDDRAESMSVPEEPQQSPDPRSQISERLASLRKRIQNRL